MPLIPPGYGHVLYSIRLVNDPDPMALTFGVKIKNPGPLPTPDIQAGCFRQAFFDGIRPQLSNAYSLERTILRWVEDDGSPEKVNIDGTVVACTNTAAPLPQNCAYLVHKLSGLTGRRNRGRLYLPGGIEGEVDGNGRLSVAHRNGVQTGMNTFKTSIDACAAFDGMYVLHNLPIASPSIPPTKVTSLLVDPVIATQRRRLR
jgi:hypothetical protein